MADFSTPHEASRNRRVAQWDDIMSSIYLEEWLKQKKLLKNDENKLRREQWTAILVAMGERCNVQLDIHQVKNHFKVWRVRLKALVTLCNTSGLSYENDRFVCSPEMWANLSKQNKEIRYWMKHDVTDMHREILRWIIDETTTGVFSNAVCEFISNAERVPIAENIKFIGARDESQPSQPSSNTSATSGGKRKKNSLNDIGHFMDRMDRIEQNLNSFFQIPSKLVEDLMGLRADISQDLYRKVSAYFIEHPKSVPIFVSYNKEMKLNWIHDMFDKI